MSTFEQHRPALVRLAYQMLGSMSEAEDIAQETWIRWQQVDQGTIRRPEAWLKTVVTRLCLDAMKSARARREVYAGPWLPEPLLEEETVLASEVSTALLLALERLSPLERAAFLLRDVFDAEFAELAHALGRSEATCRKLVSRARGHVHSARPRFTVSLPQATAIVDAFQHAARTGDQAALTGLLTAEATLHTDGGGQRLAALRVVYGSGRIARFFAGLVRKGVGLAVSSVDKAIINGLPGLVIRGPEGVVETYAFDIVGDRIAGIYVVRNPDKLRHLSTAVG